MSKRTLTTYESAAAQARGEGNTHEIGSIPLAGPWVMLCSTRINMTTRDAKRWPFDRTPRPINCPRCLATMAKRAQSKGQRKPAGLPRRPYSPATRVEAHELVGRLRRAVGACHTAHSALEIGRRWLWMLDPVLRFGEARSDREAVYDAIVAKVAETWHPTNIAQRTALGRGTQAITTQKHQRKAA